MARPTVTQMAQSILDASAALFVAAGQPFDRVCLSPGRPSGANCSQLTVHGASMVNASPGIRNDPNPQRAHARPTPTFGITTMRCVKSLTSSGNVPAVTVVQAEGERHLGDLDILWYGLTEAIAAKTLIAALGCSSFRLAQATALQPDGAAGWQVLIEVTP